MKLGTTLSGAAHVVILSWGLLTATAPDPLEVPDVESVPIEIVPVEDLAKAVKGAEEAELTETPAPKPTKKPETNPDAQNVGDAKQDTEVETEAKPEDIPTEETAEAVKAPVPQPKPVREPKPVEKAEEPTAKATEVAALPDPVTPVVPEPPVEKPKVEPKPIEKVEPVKEVVEPEPIVKEDAVEELIKQNKIPVPVVASRPKPKPAKPNTAKTNDRKELAELTKSDNGKPDAPKKKKPAKKETKVLNKKKASGGGQKKSVKTASLGTQQGKSGGKLSRNEIDKVRSIVEGCVSSPAGGIIEESLAIKVEFTMHSDGTVDKIPVVDHNHKGTPQQIKRFTKAIIRGIQKCSAQKKFTYLARDNSNEYNDWSIIAPTFYPADMFQ